MTIVRYASVFVIGIAVLVVFVRFLEPRFAFFPMRGEAETPRDYEVAYESIALRTVDGEDLRAWILSGGAPRATIVYFHGNGGNLSVWAPILAGIARQGYSVVAVDYRGYGLSTGRPSERGLYRDVDAVLDHVWNRSAATNVFIYWGRSLGTTMAAYAATKRAPAGLILESGFPDARSLVRASPPLAFLALFSTYRFSTATHLERVTTPALVMHGDADSIVPFRHGRALFEKVSGPKQFFVIRGGDHNDAAPPDPGAYWQAVNSFIAQL
jgi:hypothetical protein